MPRFQHMCTPLGPTTSSTATPTTTFTTIATTNKPKDSASTTAATVSSSTCTKCGTFTKSGKPSCCARGGAWFNKCGDPGDSKFGHTWGEGIRACKSEFMTD